MKNNKRGFLISFEAVLAILILGFCILFISQNETSDLKELLIFQQENDLLKVWSVNFPNEADIVLDTKNLFEGNAEVFIDGKQIVKCEKKKNSIASEEVLLDQWLGEHTFRVVVYFN